MQMSQRPRELSVLHAEQPQHESWSLEREETAPASNSVIHKFNILHILLSGSLKKDHLQNPHCNMLDLTVCVISQAWTP